MKKLNKLVAILVAMAMVLSLTVISAFAVWTQGVDAEPVDAALTKRVETPNGTTLKAHDFTFTFTQVTTDNEKENDVLKPGNYGYSVEADTAAIGTRTISIGTDDQANDVGDNDVYVDIVKLFTNPKSVKAGETADPQKPFPHAGVYKYTVSETFGYENDKASDETVHDSDALYTVFVVVANTADGTDLYVKNVIVIKEKNDDGTDTTGDKTAKKTGTTDGTGTDTETTGGTTENVGSPFAFTNTYVKTISTNPDGKDDDPTTQPEDESDNDAKALSIQKNVNDTAAPGQYDGKEFSFTVTVNLPSLANADVTAEVWTVDGAKTTKAYTFSDNVANNAIRLKDNERLVFPALPIGTVYTVEETNLDTQKYTKTVSGAETDTITAEGNKVKYVNALTSNNNPEGILISNLPYIALALVAIGGLVAYVVVRRKADDEA